MKQSSPPVVERPRGRTCSRTSEYFLPLKMAPDSEKKNYFPESARLPIPDQWLNQEILDLSMWN
jgi:hypothetical protein